MTRFALVAGIAALTLALAPAAAAKMCVRTTVVPKRPIAGALATIRVTIWVGSRPLVEPMAVPRSFRLTMLVVAPNRDFWMVTARRRSDRSAVLEAPFVFRRPGVWRLTWAGYPGNDSDACSGTLHVRVARV